MNVYYSGRLRGTYLIRCKLHLLQEVADVLPAQVQWLKAEEKIYQETEKRKGVQIKSFLNANIELKVNAFQAFLQNQVSTNAETGETADMSLLKNESFSPNATTKQLGIKINFLKHGGWKRHCNWTWKQWGNYTSVSNVDQNSYAWLQYVCVECARN